MRCGNCLNLNIKFNKSYFVAWGWLFLMLLSACSSQRDTSRRQANTTTYDLYNEPLHTQLVTYYESRDTLRIYAEVNTAELLFLRDQSNSPFKGAVMLEAYIFKNDGKKALPVDTVRRAFHIDQPTNTNEKAIISLKTRLPDPVVYELRVHVYDVNRKAGVWHTELLNRADTLDRHHYLLVDPQTGAPVFENHLSISYPLRVFTTWKNDTILYGHYFRRSFPLPPAPFSTKPYPAFDYNPDSTFTLHALSDGSYELHPGAKGFYHLRKNNRDPLGFTLYRFEHPHPEITQATQLAGPMVYLLSGEEYGRMIKSRESRLNVENMWIRFSGSKERARENIAKFYKRVQAANVYYTSYTEGWRTDRGLIYIVYGKPNSVYKDPQGETWIYGEENNPSTTRFSFVKVNNPFTNNDYRLIRNELYKPSWHRNVDLWRSGRVLGD